MNNILKLRKIIFSLFLCFLIVPFFVTATSYDVSITAQVGSGSGSSSSGGGGGGGGGATPPISSPTTVSISGSAYPFSKVVILKNGVVVSDTIADPNARFSVSINNLDTGTHTFAVYAFDSRNIKSLTYSFPLYITSGTTVNITGIFLSPTIAIDKKEVKKGDVISVFGQTTPSSDVYIIFHSDEEIVKKTNTDTKGLYKYDMITDVLDYGDHTVKSKTLADDNASFISDELDFKVSDKTKKIDKKKTFSPEADINNDTKINLIDFSIMVFWYQKSNPPKKVDLNNDGKVNLVDFSILAFNWTG